jgi:hypothetical protein
MTQSPSSETNTNSSSQKIPSLLRNPKVHYRVHNSPHQWSPCPIPWPCANTLQGVWSR